MGPYKQLFYKAFFFIQVATEIAVKLVHGLDPKYSVCIRDMDRAKQWKTLAVEFKEPIPAPVMSPEVTRLTPGS